MHVSDVVSTDAFIASHARHTVETECRSNRAGYGVRSHHLSNFISFLGFRNRFWFLCASYTCFRLSFTRHGVSKGLHAYVADDGFELLVYLKYSEAA